MGWRLRKWNFSTKSTNLLYIIRFEAKKPPCVQVNSSRNFELHFCDFFPSNFGPILTPQKGPKGSDGGVFHNPRSTQVWEGGHHPSRWHLAPGTCPNRPNLAPREVQNWANRTHFMPFSVNSHPTMGKFSQPKVQSGVGRWHLAPTTCPNRANLVPWQTYFMPLELQMDPA